MDQRSHSFSSVLVAAVVAAGVSVAAVFILPLPPNSVSGPGADPADGTDLTDVLERLARLERRAERPRVTRGGVNAPTDSNAPGRSAPQVDPAFVAELDVRLRALEGVEHERARAAELLEADRQLRAARSAEERRERAQTAVATMRDPAASEDDKRRAWGQLRSAADELWDDAIVNEAIRIGTTSADASIRADIWRQADANAKSPLLMRPMIQAVLYDDAPEVREEAAETLANYRDDPAVAAALEQAAQNDAEEDVRRQAESSLRDRRR